ncbi:hypothetical protein [Trichoderma gamsii cogu-like virus 1]|nr:hypothetical protein [Trichoderma gamsii cogu-like virus 1]
MGFKDMVRRASFSKKSGKKMSASKDVSMSNNHDYSQIVGFHNTANDGSQAADLGRELFSYPKPENRETMADYISGHKSGDIFPYISVTGREEETKDGRLARLRSFVSPYGKVVKPEMRINGVMLDMLEGSLHLDDLKAHVDKTRLTKEEAKENKRFKDLEEHVFTKPYLQLRKITGEFVPLLSGTSDYTDLSFCLQDGRLLDHQVIVQSNKLPTNTIGVFELSCDYCIPTKDIKQLSLKYELARPVMKEGFQWGAVSMVISVCEADTPYLTPKVEAMAINKMPYTALEEAAYDLDHKDITFTAGQIKKFRDMYTAGDIMDNDEPKKERMKQSSYSKSSIRGTSKAVAGPSHVGELSGWEYMKGMKKPLLADGEASVDAPSESEDDIDVNPSTKEEWEKQQEALRAEMQMTKYNPKEAIGKTKAIDRTLSTSPPESLTLSKVASVSSVSDDSEPEIFKRIARKKRVGFNVQDV